jgi:DNA-binding response OmpR family regulator
MFLRSNTTIPIQIQTLRGDVPDLLATNVVLIDGSGTSLARQAEAAGAKVLMITGSPDKIVEFDGSGQRYLSKPFPPETFLQRVQQILS